MPDGRRLARPPARAVSIWVDAWVGVKSSAQKPAGILVPHAGSTPPVIPRSAQDDKVLAYGARAESDAALEV